MEWEVSSEHQRSSDELREREGYNHLVDKSVDELVARLNFYDRERKAITDELERRVREN